MSKLYKILEPNLSYIIELSIRFYNIGKWSKPEQGIAYINTHDRSGGASKVAFMLADHFRKKEKQTGLWVHAKKTAEPWVFEMPSRAKTHRFWHHVEYAAQNGGWLDIEKISPLNLFTDSHFQRCDIVHFHNLHGGYFSYALLPYFAKSRKLIWTLHDEHIITGHCGFSMKCKGWETGCGDCPDLNIYPSVKKDRTKELLRLKRKWISRAAPLLIAPSQWLAERIRYSYPELASRVKVIPNGINTDVFKPDNQKAAHRKKLGWNLDWKVVFYAAELSTQNPYKGGKIIMNLLESGLPPGWKLVTVGGNTSRFTNDHIPIGYISSEQEMCELMKASDVMLYPTAADNHPLIVLEALASGLPVVASHLGGIPEIISEGKNGFLVSDYQNPGSFLNALIRYFNLPQDDQSMLAEFSAQDARVRFNAKRMFMEYEQTYQWLREHP